jgi:hypothetical protein
MAGTGDALRRTSDALLRDLEALLHLEEEKRTVDPGDPRLVDLAARIELVAKRVLAGSTSQRAQTQLIHELTETGSPAAPVTPIEDTPRSMEAILAAWRQAERQLDAAEPGSAEATEAEVLVDQLREEYRRAHDEATRETH